MSDFKENELLCVLCEKPSFLACGVCQELYCSEECQDKDWRQHKYICTTKPKLVKITSVGKQSGVFRLRSPIYPRVAFRSAQSAVSVVPSPPLNNAKKDEIFRSTECFIPSSRTCNVYIHCLKIVHNGTEVWVTELKHMPTFKDFIGSLTDFMTKVSPRKLQNLEVGSVGIVYDGNECYRAEILQVKIDTQSAFVRLIDTGKTFIYPLGKLFEPTSSMIKYPRFAFKVIFSKILNEGLRNTCQDILLKDKIDEETFTGDLIESKVCFNLPIEKLLIHPQIFYVNIISNEKRIALVHLKASMEIDKFMTNLKVENINEKELEMGSLVLAIYGQQIRRGRFICTTDQENCGIFYDMDSASYGAAKKFLKIPPEILKEPLNAFAMKFSETFLIEELERKDINKNNLSLKICKSCLNINDSVDAVLCLEQSGLIQSQVSLISFTGLPLELNLPYIHIPVKPETLVCITYVESNLEIYVSQIYSQFFGKYFDENGMQAPLSNYDALKVDNMAFYTENGKKFQRVLIKGLPDSKSSYFSLYDIDSGETITFTKGKGELRSIQSNVLSAPCLLRKIRFDSLHKTLTTNKLSKLFEFLNTMKDQKAPFRLVQKEDGNFDLFDYNKNSISSILWKLSQSMESDENTAQKKTSSVCLDPEQINKALKDFKFTAIDTQLPIKAQGFDFSDKKKNFNISHPDEEFGKSSFPRNDKTGDNIGSALAKFKGFDSAEICSSSEKSAAGGHVKNKGFGDSLDDSKKSDLKSSKSPEGAKKPSSETSRSLADKSNDRPLSRNSFISAEALNTKTLRPTEVTKEEKKKFFLDDLPIIPLPLGDRKVLKVLDMDCIDKGILTCADNSNLKALTEMEIKNQKLDYFCRSIAAEHTSYEPQVGELCIALFEDDNCWYRCVCLDKLSEKSFHIMFIDYGNMMNVAPNKIMPFLDDCLYATTANSCKIADFDASNPKKAVQLFTECYDPENETIVCNVSQTEDMFYSIKLCPS